MAQIVRALPRAVQNGKDRKARMVMANGDLLAGAAFSNSMVGLVHAIGHALGGRVPRGPRGGAMTILLPAVMKYNLEVQGAVRGAPPPPPGRAGGPTPPPPAELRAQKTIDTLVALRQQPGRPHRPAHHPVPDRPGEARAV